MLASGDGNGESHRDRPVHRRLPRHADRQPRLSQPVYDSKHSECPSIHTDDPGWARHRDKHPRQRGPPAPCAARTPPPRPAACRPPRRQPPRRPGPVPEPGAKPATAPRRSSCRHPRTRPRYQPAPASAPGARAPASTATTGPPVTPTTGHPSLRCARDELADLVNRVAYGHERITLTRHGKPVAAPVPPEDLAWLQQRSQEGINLTATGQTFRIQQPSAPEAMPLAARHLAEPPQS